MYINKSFINLPRIERTMFAFRIIGGLHKCFFPSVELRCVNFPHLEMFHTILYTQLPLLESIFSFSTR